jgi:carbon monoxide dehydrogenase subunit G
MQLKGTYTFQAPRGAVWEALMDPTVLAQALPGGEQLEQVGDHEYKAAMNVRVGPVQGKFSGSVELADIEPLTSYRMKVSGAGPAGFVNGEGAIVLDDAEAGTLMNYQGEVQVGGRIAGVGQRLIDSTAKSIIKQGLKVMDDQIQYRLAPPPPAVATTPSVGLTLVEDPSGRLLDTGETAASVQPPQATTSSAAKLAGEVAKEVARDLASDYIPLNQQEKIFYAALGALGMLLFVILVRLVQRD